MTTGKEWVWQVDLLPWLHPLILLSKDSHPLLDSQYLLMLNAVVTLCVVLCLCRSLCYLRERRPPYCVTSHPHLVIVYVLVHVLMQGLHDHMAIMVHGL
jgi:hypothetical protein